MARRPLYKLSVRDLGPIRTADLEFGDLTVLVGPQATGKSILLQTLKLVLDRDNIHDTFTRHNVVFNGDASAFLGGYFGKGMASLWSSSSLLTWRERKESLPALARNSKAKARDESVYFIPAQRVMSLAGGVSQNFGQFNYGDPYTLRRFSDSVHNLLQNEFGAKGELFPQSNRLNATLREPITKHLFGTAKLEVDAKEFTKSLVIRLPGHEVGLPYLAWSAGQREFTPLLLGLYWLCPAGKVSRRGTIEWVVIEEPEMGLHPDAVATVLLLVLELIRRGYRVVLSTHSAVVLDMVWALRVLQDLGGDESDVRALFELPGNDYAKDLARAALAKRYRVFFCERNGTVRDISRLDPGAESDAESSWGQLTGFASRVGDVISAAVGRSEARDASRKHRRKSEASE